MSAALSTALSALTAARVAIRTAGQNVANAATPGYSRQRVGFSSLTPERTSTGQYVGRGVGISSIERVADSFLAGRLREQRGAQGRAAAERDAFADLEQAFGDPQSNGLNTSVADFFGKARAAGLSPGDPAANASVVQQAKTLAQTFRSVRSAIRSSEGSVTEAIREQVGKINRTLEAIGAQNRAVAAGGYGGNPPADVLDQMDRLLGELSSYVDVEAETSSGGQLTVFIAGEAAVTPGSVRRLTAASPSVSGGSTRVRIQGASADLAPKSGSLGALIDLEPRIAAGRVADLDALAANLIRRANHVQATGVPGSGGFESLKSAIRIKDTDGDGSLHTERISAQNLPFPIKDGKLTVTVTNAADGTTSRVRIPIVAATTTTGGLIAQLDAVPGMSASIDPAGRLRISAEPGFKFDFSNRVHNRPDPTGAFGVAVEAGGTFTGTSDEPYIVRALSAGQIGVTDPLSVQVERPDGSIVGTLNVGLGYSPGTPLELASGLTVSFGAGSIDPLTNSPAVIEGVADGDSAGVLTALGINGLFLGRDAATIEVDPDVLAQPTRLATGSGGGPGDSSGLQRFAALEFEAHPVFGGRTFAERYEGMVGEAGYDAARASDGASIEDRLMEAIESRRQQASGVNLDEELLLLQEFEKSYEAVARFVQTLRQTDDLLFRLLG